MSVTLHPSSVNKTKNMIQVDPTIFVKMSTYIDDQIATSKLLQAEIDLLAGNYETFTSRAFLHDIKRRRNASI